MTNQPRILVSDTLREAEQNRELSHNMLSMYDYVTGEPMARFLEAYGATLVAEIRSRVEISVTVSGLSTHRIGVTEEIETACTDRGLGYKVELNDENTTQYTIREVI